MKYSVVYPRLGAVHVVASYPFAWMAQLHLALFRRVRPEINGAEVAQVTQDPQDIINICEQRDAAIRASHTEYFRAHEAALALYALVARDDSGAWTTVHAADTPVGDDTSALLNRILA
jgi:hypothetical protein